MAFPDYGEVAASAVLDDAYEAAAFALPYDVETVADVAAVLGEDDAVLDDAQADALDSEAGAFPGEVAAFAVLGDADEAAASAFDVVTLAAAAAAAVCFAEVDCESVSCGCERERLGTPCRRSPS